jgi:hypothetical protein
MFRRLIVVLALRSLLLAMGIAGIVCIFIALVSWSDPDPNTKDDQTAIHDLSVQR